MSLVTRFRGWVVALGSLAVGLAGLTAIAIDSGQQGMAHMAGHMYMTVLRPAKARRPAESRRHRGRGKNSHGALPGLPQGPGGRL